MLWLLLLLLLVLVIFLVYKKIIKPLSYWQEQGVPYQKAWPILGNMAPVALGQKSIFELVRDFYNYFPDKRYGGIHQFTQPTLLIRDIDLIKQIAVKDFDHFTDHKQLVAEDSDPLLGKDLFSLKGQKWRDMRATLSPSFTSSKMKAMFSLVSECAQQFTQYFQNQQSDLMVVEIKEIFTRFTNDAIASIAFGLKVDSLKDRKNEFFLMGEDATNFTGIRGLRVLLFSLGPSLMKYLKISFFPRATSDFFRRIVKETIQQREREGIIRPDMIHLLMEARKGRLRKDDINEVVDSGFAVAEEMSLGKTQQKPELSDDDITSQAFLFFFAGFDTAASLLSFLSYELATHPDIQEMLQNEVDDTLENCNGKITYEALLGMKYLDMVISETLRKWPPGFRLDRVCVKDYTIKPENKNEQPVTLKKDDLLIISVSGIHSDPKFFPDPERFDPERFNENNKRNIIPGSYMPFGVGPRNCIGSRLALLECKILIFHFLTKFNFMVVEKTTIPLKLARKPFPNIMFEGGLWLGIQQRKT